LAIGRKFILKCDASQDQLQIANGRITWNDWNPWNIWNALRN